MNTWLSVYLYHFYDDYDKPLSPVKHTINRFYIHLLLNMAIVSLSASQLHSSSCDVLLSVAWGWADWGCFENGYFLLPSPWTESNGSYSSSWQPYFLAVLQLWGQGCTVIFLTAPSELALDRLACPLCVKHSVSKAICSATMPAPRCRE